MLRLTAIREDGWNTELLEKAGKIWTLLVYDDAERTYCCELTPSYCLWPVEIVCEKNGLDEEEMLECNLAAGNDGGPIYMHCRSVKSGAPLPELSECDAEQAASELRSNPISYDVIDGELRAGETLAQTIGD